ncbi:hypothetical protein ACFWTE_19860 [Nocardiopsis sp. NPDC058631]|uniref:methyltransferase family protein n=1 Tax=Nocardiopsis sp. NPDC058631 TaxID=3346566 RepID=UPI003657781B
MASAPSNEQSSGALSARMAGMLSGFAVSQALYAVAKLDLAAKLLAGPRTPAELAEEAGVSEDPLRRVLHTLSGVGVVTHQEGGRFAVTDLGATLARETPGPLHGTALMWMETHYEAFGELLGTLRTGRTGFALHHGQEFVPYLREHPEHLPALTSAMAELNGGRAGPCCPTTGCRRARSSLTSAGPTVRCSQPSWPTTPGGAASSWTCPRSSPPPPPG